jgi:hypothetical protein
VLSQPITAAASGLDHGSPGVMLFASDAQRQPHQVGDDKRGGASLASLSSPFACKIVDLPILLIYTVPEFRVRSSRAEEHTRPLEPFHHFHRVLHKERI